MKEVESRARVGVGRREGSEEVEGNSRVEGRGTREGVEGNEESLGVGRRETHGNSSRERGDVGEGVVEESEAVGVVGEEHKRLGEDSFSLDGNILVISVVEDCHLRSVEWEGEV